MTATLNYKKKLIEVAIPLEAINAASAREKSIRHGHPSTLHLWWARRPLAACRAVLFAQLVDDPSSQPEQFPTAELQDAERKRLFAIIEDLVKWENSTNEEVLERARAEIRRSCGGVLPPVYDPFSGGGSIPLEAQRLGLPAYGSDLNPVAVMIGKAMIEIPPKFKDQKPIHPGVKDRSFYRNAEGLAEDVKYYGEWMREKAWERIGHLYPQDLPKVYGGGKATVIAWIWARTVPSPDPAFSGAHVPITSSFLLSSKPGKEVWIEPIVDKILRTIKYRINRTSTTDQLKKARSGTKSGKGSNFLCLLSESAITAEYIKRVAGLGQIGVTLIAVVADSKNGRIFIDPSESQLNTAFLEKPTYRPSTPISPDRRAFTPPDYGMKTFGDLFTDRQLIALNCYADLVHEVMSEIKSAAQIAGLNEDNIPIADGGKGALAYAEAISVYLAFGLSRLSDVQNSLCMWETSKTQVRHLFTRQAIPILWDFGENNVFNDAAGDFRTSLGSIIRVLERFVPSVEGFEKNHDAQTVVLPAGAMLSTDPPYYDNVGYADLADFFFCWLKPALKDVYPALFGVLATPKAEELIAAPYRHGGKQGAEQFFLDGMRDALTNLAKQASDALPATIYYAFKQSEIDQDGISSTGWSTFLQATLDAGFAVVGTWPVRTELSNRMRGQGSNALANSVVLVCRKKEATAEVITRAEFIRALKRELPPAIGELQAANIAPADMPQSAIGPGMGVFSRYKAVLESDDSPMSVKAALQLINRELDEYLGGIQGEFDADTRFAITWFEQNGLKAGEYGTANSIATARGISVESVKHAGIVESQAGKVRVLRREELDEAWDPGSDPHLTVWECLQHLVRVHEAAGISHDTALLLKKLGDKAEAVKDLAYCLYDICANKRQDAKEATAYNALIADWTELSRRAASVYDTRGDLQQRLDL
jgi:putative DNA methylase